jgi:GT2 family glycosyltransferase
MTDNQPQAPTAPVSPRPRVLAIVVNWNKIDFVRKLLARLQGLRRPPDDIVLVDNASTDGTADMARRDFPAVHLVCNAENLGGSGGFNSGLRWGLENGPYDYFWLLDNDVIVHEGALEALLDVAEADPKVGMVGSRLVVIGDPELTQECGVVLDWPKYVLLKQGECERFPAWPDPNPTIFDVDYGAACSVLARVSAVEEVGIWYSGYFVYNDDIEWGVRFKRAGWKVKATSASVVEHENNNERRLLCKPFQLYLNIRNALFFMANFAPRKPRMIFFLLDMRRKLSTILKAVLSGQRGTAKATALAIYDFFLSRMGPCPHTFEEDAPVDFPAFDQDKLGDEIPNRRGRLLFWNMSRTEETRRIVEKARRVFPNHKIDLLVQDDLSALKDFTADGVIRTRTRSWMDRLRLSRWARKNHDAVIHGRRDGRMLWEFRLPVAIWYSDDGVFGWSRNRAWHFWLLLFAFPVFILGALCLLALEELKPKARVNYFDWKKKPENKA